VHVKMRFDICKNAFAGEGPRPGFRKSKKIVSNYCKLEFLKVSVFD